MQAVLDTNVLISGLLWHGPSADCLLAAERGDFDLVLSESILDELREKLIAKFAYSRADAALAVARIRIVAQIVPTMGQGGWVVNDPDDDKIVETAVNGGAELIVSGDRHLLALVHLAGIEVIEPREFLRRLSASPPAI